MPSEKLVLTESNLVSLEAKFAEEIQELEETLRLFEAQHQHNGSKTSTKQQRQEGEDPGVVQQRSELKTAIAQSLELLEELQEVRKVYADCREKNRTFSQEENDAFEYFGFVVPASGRPEEPIPGAHIMTTSNGHNTASAPAAVSTTSIRSRSATPVDALCYQLPASRRSVSQSTTGRSSEGMNCGGGPVGCEGETETDIYDWAPRAERFSSREDTPDQLEEEGEVPMNYPHGRQPTNTRSRSTTPTGTLDHGSAVHTYAARGRSASVGDCGAAGNTNANHPSSSAVEREVAVRLEKEVARMKYDLSSDFEQQRRQLQRDYDDKLAKMQASYEQELERRADTIASHRIEEFKAHHQETEEQRQRQEAEEMTTRQQAAAAPVGPSPEEFRQLEEEYISLRNERDQLQSQLHSRHKDSDGERKALEERVVRLQKENEQFRSDLRESELLWQRRDAEESEQQNKREAESLSAFAEENARWRETVQEINASQFRTMQNEIRTLQEAHSKKLLDFDAVRKQLLQHDAEIQRRQRSSSGGTPPSLADKDVAEIVANARVLARGTEHTTQYVINEEKHLEPVDRALLVFLNSAGFPFPLAIQRLGPRGEYFIDQRVHLRLLNDELLVRPVHQPGGASSSLSGDQYGNSSGLSSYEPLAKYLVQLYASVLAAHRGSFAANNTVSVSQPREDHDAPTTRPAKGHRHEEEEREAAEAEEIRQLEEKQLRLKQKLAEQQTLLLAHHQALEDKVGGAGRAPSNNSSPVQIPISPEPPVVYSHQQVPRRISPDAAPHHTVPPPHHTVPTERPLSSRQAPTPAEHVDIPPTPEEPHATIPAPAKQRTTTPRRRIITTTTAGTPPVAGGATTTKKVPSTYGSTGGGQGRVAVVGQKPGVTPLGTHETPNTNRQDTATASKGSTNSSGGFHLPSREELSRMSKEELEQLKKAALAQQLREAKAREQQQQQVKPRR